MDHWLRRPWVLIAMFALLLALACGSSATATPVATNTPSATNTPVSSDTETPTSAVSPTPRPTGDAVAGPEYAPAFEEYWQPNTEFYGQPIKGGVFRFIYEDPLDHGNVWGAYSGVTSRLRNPVHNQLIQEDPYDSSKFIPGLASGWAIDEDLHGVTLNLRDNVKWHNGEDFTCEDARFSIQILATGEGLSASELKGKWSHFSSYECVDDYTLRVGFTGPSATVLPDFSDRAALIFNKAWFEAGGEEAMFNDLSVGTGPFMWKPGQDVGVDEQHFVANPDYFIEGLPYVDEVVVFGIVDESRQQSSMLAHQGDFHWVRNWGQYDSYVEHDQIMTAIRATRGHHSIWLNKRNPPLDNVEVRKAIYMSLDREAAIQVLQDGHGVLGFLMAPGSPWELSQEKGCQVPGWCPPADGDMDRQRAEAKAILEQQGFDFNKTFILSVESDAQVQQRATFVQEQLRLLGIKTDVDLVETVAYRAEVREGRWKDILPRNDTMTQDDPALGMGFYFRCVAPNNHWGPPTPENPCDETMENYLDQAATTVDPEQRKAVSDEQQLYAMEQYWKFPLYWEQEAAAFWPEVRGYAHFPAPFGGFTRWEHIWLDPAHKDDSGNNGQTTGVPGGI